MDNQVRLAIVTSLLVAITLQQTLVGADGSRDIKASRRQARRKDKAPLQSDGTDRPL